MIATCNYVARRYGIRSAMATAHALRLCPRLHYRAVWRYIVKYRGRLCESFARYSREIIEPVSIDEAYLDVSDSPLFQGSATRIAEAIRADIQRELNLTASAGVAPNKFLAKMLLSAINRCGLFVLSPQVPGLFVNWRYRASPVSGARLPSD